MPGLRPHHQLAPVHRVGQQSGKEQQNDLGQGARQPEQADVKRRLSQLVYLPGYRNRIELTAEAGTKRTGPENAKIAMAEWRTAGGVIMRHVAWGRNRRIMT